MARPKLNKIKFCDKLRWVVESQGVSAHGMILAHLKPSAVWYCGETCLIKQSKKVNSHLCQKYGFCRSSDVMELFIMKQYFVCKKWLFIPPSSTSYPQRISKHLLLNLEHLISRKPNFEIKKSFYQSSASFTRCPQHKDNSSFHQLKSQFSRFIGIIPWQYPFSTSPEEGSLVLNVHRKKYAR